MLGKTAPAKRVADVSVGQAVSVEALSKEPLELDWFEQNSSIRTKIGEEETTGLVRRVNPNSIILSTTKGLCKFALGSKFKPLSARANLLLRAALRKNIVSVLGSKGYAVCGSDPEIFAIGEDGIVIPAWEFLPEKPVSSAVETVFWDGVQGEMTTKPSGCLAYQVDSIQRGLAAVKTALKKRFPRARLSYQPVVEVPAKILDGAREEHVALGCAPSKNAYLDEKAICVPDPRALKYRFAGFHLHLGMAGKVATDGLVKALDKILAVVMTAMLAGLDDPIRRQWYGKAGEHRVPLHGLEYRVLSSALFYHPILVHIAFDLARLVMSIEQDGLASVWFGEEELVREIINNCDYKGARRLVKKNLAFLRAILTKVYSVDRVPSVLRLVLEGARELLPDDLEANWRLNGEKNWVDHSEGVDECVRTMRDLK